MNERNGARFEGMVLAKLSGLDERMDELLNAVRAMEERWTGQRAAHASLAAEVRALRERTDFHMRVIWSAVAWVVVAAAGVMLAAFGAAP